MIVAMDIQTVTSRRIEGMQLQRLDGCLMFSTDIEETNHKEQFKLVEWRAYAICSKLYAAAESGNQ